MKIVRFGMQMQETLGLLDDQNNVRSLKGVFDLSNNESIGDQIIIEKLKNIEFWERYSIKNVENDGKWLRIDCKIKKSYFQWFSVRISLNLDGWRKLQLP